VTIRDSTERPETVKAGANIVSGIEPDRIIAAAAYMLDKKRSWKNPFGDGHAGERILDIISAR
jgi:UDP-N-acetylglucosamine 2-epimerase (non-hydrolysing)